MNCRHCGHHGFIPFVDLVNSPASNSMLRAQDLMTTEPYYPLKVDVCENCFLAQVDEFKKAEDIFDADYTYFSSFSSSWLKHCEAFASYAIKRFGLGSASKVVEVASNDGYLLQYFMQAGIPVQGVEPTANTAAVAQQKGIDTLVEFFGEEMARSKLAGQADLICGNNVYAHVPDINDFTAGLKAALKPGGVVSLEFPHLLRLIEETQFDTIYHEHFSYLSLEVVVRIMASQGLRVFDVQELTTHGGSLRVFACHDENRELSTGPAVSKVIEAERQAGLKGQDCYNAFQDKVDGIRDEFVSFLIEQRRTGKVVAGYGAAAKGNTLLNYCGIKGTSLMSCVADLSPHKQGRHLPGSHIPVVPPAEMMALKPDFIVILPWNLKDEIMHQLADAKAWGGKFVVAIPELKVM